MFELEIGLIDWGELNFDKPFLNFNVKKKIYAKGYFKKTISIKM